MTSNHASTYERALTLLGFRARSVSELRRKLLQKGESAAQVEEVIARLLDQKLLDDADFARQFARTKLLDAGASRFRIAQELARKGVARPIADAAIAALEEDEGLNLSASVHRVAEKKWNSMRTLEEITRKRRLYAYLARRGFNPDEIRDAMAALSR